MWDEPFADEDYTCGREPNSFLVSVISMLAVGKTLCLADRGGASAVYLASRGFQVLAVDDSAHSLSNTEQLARESNVSLETRLVNWAEFEPGVEAFENIVSVFCHVVPQLRRRLNPSLVRALRPGGMFLLEAYRPQQPNCGGRAFVDVNLLVSREQIYEELDGLDWIRVGQVVKSMNEGPRHQGHRALLEVLARKRHVHRPQGLMQ